MTLGAADPDPDSALSRAGTLASMQAAARQCRRCVDAGHLPHARPVFAGDVGCAVMLIGQAPGARSEATGRPFAGPSGRVLAAWLDQAGFAPGYFPDRVYCTSLTRCFPGPNPSGSGDRPPGPDERALCREWLDAELAIVRPPVVLLVGRMAIEACYPVGRVGALSAVVGTSATGSGTLYLPLPHPSGASRWLNTPANRLLVDRALAELSAARVRLGL